MSLSRRTPSRRTHHRKTPKITLIAAGSALALAAIAAGTVANWPGDTPAASAQAATARKRQAAASDPSSGAYGIPQALPGIPGHPGRL